MRVAEDGAADWGPHQQGKGREGETHAQPRSKGSHILRDGHHHHRRQRDESSGEEPVQDREHDNAGGVVDRDPAEGQNAGDCRSRSEHVERARIVSEEIRHHSTERRGSVEHRQEVEPQVFVDNSGLDRVRLDVVQIIVKAKETQEDANAEKHELQLLESRQLQQGPFLHGLEPHPQHGERDATGPQTHEAQDPCRPWKANLPLQPIKHDGIDDAADAAPGRGDAVRKASFPAEILRQDRDGRHEQTARPKPDTDTLRKHELPVLGGQTGHHQSERDQEGPRPQQQMEVACVEERARDDADQHQEERLDRSDPGDRRGGHVREDCLLIVGLKNTKRVDDSPGDSSYVSKLRGGKKKEETEGIP